MSSDQPSRLQRIFRVPSWQTEVVLWALVIVATIGIRLYLTHLLPIALWSKDASSYTNSALAWVHTGVWETDPRRGPVYSLLIAACAKAFGSLPSVMICQHAMGALAILATLGVARFWMGRKSAVPLALCGLSYGLYDVPLNLEHMIRNETVLFFFGSLTFASWLLALHQGKARWLWITGISAALVTLTKNIYAPFPFLLVAGYLFWGRADLRAALKSVAVFAIAFALPFVGVKVLDSFSAPRRPAEPQSGILLYGRTAQFTVLDGGKYPEIKEAIRQEVEDYRNLPVLDNNIIIYHTVIPHLERILREQGKGPKELNRLCRELGVEAIHANRVAYIRQMANDLSHLLFTSIRGSATPSLDDLKGVRKILLTLKVRDSLVDIPGMIQQLDEAGRGDKFGVYYLLISTSLLFRLVPALLTSLLLPYLFWKARGSIRLWWFGLSGVWYFNLVVLCTVGRPLSRYMIPVLPIMFWTLAAGIALLWEAQRVRLASKETLERLKQPGGMV